LQLENWGLDLEALKAKKVRRIFRAWVEDWEKESIKVNDPVSEITLMEKYKGLCFFDPAEEVTWTIEGGNMEWMRRNAKKKIEGGWYLLAKDEEGNLEAFEIEDELCDQIADTQQGVDGMVIIRRAEEGEEKTEE
jgi:hypothetical protein